MELKYAFFPGCSLHASAEEYRMSCDRISEVLGIDLVELDDWNCCSSIDAVYAYNPEFSIFLSARNLSIAEKMGMDLVTLCSACFFTLSRANRLLSEDKRLRNNVDKALKSIGLKYDGKVKVRHYLDVLINDVGLSRVSENVKSPLKGLKVASYYGCLLIRPPEITGFDDPEHPRSMDDIVRALGADSVDYIDRIRCCGASLMVTKENVAMEMTKNILLNAKDAGADCIITPCPMCHFNLDARQHDIESRYGVEINLPVLYFTQLIGLAYSLEPEKLGLNRNCVSVEDLLKKLKST